MYVNNTQYTGVIIRKFELYSLLTKVQEYDKHSHEIIDQLMTELLVQIKLQN